MPILASSIIILYLAISSLDGMTVDPVTMLINDIRLRDPSLYTTKPISDSIQLQGQLEPTTNSYQITQANFYQLSP